jgi:flagellar hook-associated protein FlgK
MTQMLGLLSIGAGALFSQQRAINVTGNNIANVNTPGYSRQRVGMETTALAGSFRRGRLRCAHHGRRAHL